MKDVFNYAKAYGKSKGMDIRCYVPTHSLVNYSQWQIVSPEASHTYFLQFENHPDGMRVKLDW